MRAGSARRVAAILAIAWGVVVAGVSAISIPDAQAAQRLVDGARPLVAPGYLAREQTLLADGRVAAQQLTDTALPRLAAALGERSDQLAADIVARYPDVATGLRRLPAILATTGLSLANLQLHHADFVDADTFPAAGVSRPVAAMAGIVAGVLLALLGVLALAGARLWPLPAILLLAAAGALAPLLASMPEKAQGVSNMVGALNLSTATATATRQSFTVVQRLHDQLLGEMVPDAAARLGVSTDALVAEIDSGLDTLQAALREYPTVLATFRPDVELREHAVADFQRLKSIPVVTVTWLLIAVSGVVAAAAALALAGLPRRGR